MHIVIMGAGIAGLSAALRLLKEKHQVTIVEKNRLPGGRLWSYVGRNGIPWMDNGPHVLIECNPAVKQYLNSIYSGNSLNENHLFRPVEEILCVEQGRSWILPLTLSKVWKNLFSSGPLKWRDWFSLLQAVKKIKCSEDLFQSVTGKPVDEVLNELNQSPRSIRYFWEPLCLALMNCSPFKADASTFLHTLWTIVVNDEVWRLYIPRKPLQEIFILPAVQRIMQLGGELFYGSPVIGFEYAGSDLRAVRLKGGKIVYADGFISALPPWDLSAIEPSLITGHEVMDASPILSVYMQCGKIFSRYGESYPAVACYGETIQWLFIRDDGVIGAVVSDAGRWMKEDPGLIGKAVRNDICKLFNLSSADDCKILKVIKQRKSTLRLDPQNVAHRPGAETPFRNLFLSGDWTNTGFPCSVEGAVMSGYGAAEMILKRSVDKSFPSK